MITWLGNVNRIWVPSPVSESIVILPPIRTRLSKPLLPAEPTCWKGPAFVWGEPLSKRPLSMLPSCSRCCPAFRCFFASTIRMTCSQLNRRSFFDNPQKNTSIWNVWPSAEPISPVCWLGMTKRNQGVQDPRVWGRGVLFARCYYLLEQKPKMPGNGNKAATSRMINSYNEFIRVWHSALSWLN